MAVNGSDMDNLDMETSSDNEEELIASLIDDDDDDDGVRYSLRTRTRSFAGARLMDPSFDATDSGDEPYTSTGLRPLLAGGQGPDAVRMDPKTRMCDNATATGISRRGATGKSSKAAGRGGDEVHSVIARSSLANSSSYFTPS